MKLSRISAFFLAVSAIPALVVTAAAAHAADGLAREDGERLLVACTAAQRLIGGETPADRAEHVDAMLCIGFLEGFSWGHGWAAWRRNEEMYFCPPEGFDYRDAVPAIVSYLHEYPHRRIQRAHLLVFSALSRAFPCTP